MEIEKSGAEFRDKKKCMSWHRRSKLERCFFIICIILIIVFITTIALITGLHNKNSNNEVIPKEKICLTPICKQEAGRILQNMDTSVNPCDDFFKFTCGSYLKYRDIYSDWIDPDTELRGHIKYLEKEALEKSEESTKSHNYIEKVKKFYKSCLKKSTSVKQILDDILDALQISGWPFTEYPRDKHLSINIEKILAKFMLYEPTGIFYRAISHTQNDTLQYIYMSVGYAAVYSEALLNDTDEYLIQLKEKYKSLFRYVFIRIGLDPTDINEIMNEIIDFETRLARMTENVSYNTTMVTISNLDSICNQIKWSDVFKFLFEYMDHLQNYNNGIQLEVNLELMMSLCKLFENTKPRIIYNTVIWNIVIKYLYELDFIFRELSFDEKRGIAINILMPKSYKRQKWRECIEDFRLPFTFGLEYYMLEYTQAVEEIKEIESYVKEVLKATEEIISEKKWIDDYSKDILISKVKNVKYRIGYTNSSLIIPMLTEIFSKIKVTDNHVKNIIETDKYIHTDTFFGSTLSKLDSKRERFDTFKVNAYYSDENAGLITVPLGIMQPPYFAYGAPRYLNYGGIGSTIGHEISHGFGELERMKVESGGNEKVVDWPKKFLNEFKERKNCLIKQYSKLPLEGNITIEGRRTIDDDFSDNSGMVIAYRAYKRYLQQHDKEPNLPGFDYTNEQMFFIASAQEKCEKVQSLFEVYGREMHSPNKYRTLVPLMNFKEFSKVFNCPSNSYMNPEQKCEMWD
ncbi:neprilysin-11-like [Centruroides vittatus]|uniref:neprilysin-11-like n=1 Tax=Centruroides vittatus TaxID=120091 RepID=UPI0035101E87